jgi:hypothetical protein
MAPAVNADRGNERVSRFGTGSHLRASLAPHGGGKRGPRA